MRSHSTLSAREPRAKSNRAGQNVCFAAFRLQSPSSHGIDDNNNTASRPTFKHADCFFFFVFLIVFYFCHLCSVTGVTPYNNNNNTDNNNNKDVLLHCTKEQIFNQVVYSTTNVLRAQIFVAIDNTRCSIAYKWQRHKYIIWNTAATTAATARR